MVKVKLKEWKESLGTMLFPQRKRRKLEEELVLVKALLAILMNPDLPKIGGYQGICTCVSLSDKSVDRSFSKYFETLAPYKTWKKFSGNEVYPVPHPEYHPRSAYLSSSRGLLWKGEYGENRREYLRHIIKVVSGRIETLEITLGLYDQT